MAGTTPKKPRKKATSGSAAAETYTHSEATALVRPDIGLQTQFKKKKEPATYAYDPSIDPRLEWAGKAERTSFTVPTLPLFVHERLSTEAILATLKGHKRDKQMSLDFYADPQLPIADQLLRAYEHKDRWANRLILGDSLVVMNSLLQFEQLGGQVHMVYMDPPYGVRFGSNFQPFVRKRDVANNDDQDMTREPEMVQAYRDTWELDLHSYLTYLRDRLLLARELLDPSGSIFVQIGEDNAHLVRQVMEEVFGRQNFVVTIVLKKKGNQKSDMVAPINDYIIWFAKDKQLAKERFTKLFVRRELDEDVLSDFNYVEMPDGSVFTIDQLTKRADNDVDYASNPKRLVADFPGCRLFDSKDLTVGGVRKNQSHLFEFKGKMYDPGLSKGLCWKHTAQSVDGSPSGMQRLVDADRVFAQKDQIRYKRYFDDFGYEGLSNLWTDIGGAKDRVYVVQTNVEAVKRCILMTTQPGDLVFDPTCGSGTTAYVAEQWGRRWITADVSRVPIALARQRLLTATYPWYALRDERRGPAGGFTYEKKTNNRGEQVGGIVQHVTSSTIANSEQPTEEIMVDRPAQQSGVTRVTGPFAVEASIPVSLPNELGDEPSQTSADYEERMLQVLRSVGTLHTGGNQTVAVSNVRRPAKTLALSAEAQVSTEDMSAVAFVFGPEDAAVSETLVYAAAKEAAAKGYVHLYVIGFAIQPNARRLVETSDGTMGIPATYVQATPDLLMGDLLKNMRSSQIFSVCGMPEVKIHADKDPKGVVKFRVELIGLDTFNPVTMDADHLQAENVPCWMLDTDYNDRCFHVSQAFFPRTSAWENLRKSLKGAYQDSVWEHLSGTTSEPFEAGDERKVAVKVVDDRGNELLIIEPLPRVK